MASVDVSQRMVVNPEDGTRGNAVIETQVDTMMVGTEGALGAVSTTGLTWIPVMEPMVEFEVVENSGSKAGKMKARARAKAKEKPAGKVSAESAAPTHPPARKSQRVRQPPAKFRYLVPRPLGQQTLPPVAPAFIHPPSSNGIPPLPLPHNVMMPFPPIPVSTSGSSALSPPATTAAALHLSSFPRINDQPLQPTSTLAATPTPTPAVPLARPACVEHRRYVMANKRSAVRKKLSPSPYQEHAGLSQSSSSQSEGGSTGDKASSNSVEAIIVSETAVSAGLSSTITKGSTNVCVTRVSSSLPWPNAGQAPRSSFRPYFSSNFNQTTASPCVETGAATTVQGRSARKPPLPPNPWYLKILRRNPPHPPPAIFKRSFAHVPPPPTHDSHPIVPPRASLNNRDLRFPKPVVSQSGLLLGKSQVVRTSSNPQSVPWLVPPQQDANQCGIADSDAAGHSNGMSVPGQTRTQQKRRLRQLKNGIGKKFQNLMQGAKLIQERGDQRNGVSTVKQIVLTDEQRTKLVNDMIEACRTDPKFRAKYLDAVKQLSYFGVLQTASYQLVAQGPSIASQEVVDAWKNQPPPNHEGSTSASIKFYRAVNKVHEEGIETMEKLPSLKEAGSCSLTKRNDGAWVFTLPDEKKRKLNGEERPSTNGS